MRRLFEVRPAFFLLLAAIVPCGCSILNPDSGPTAAFQASKRSGIAPLQIQFTDQSREGTSHITEWTWRFGDGAKSSDRNPVHVYEDPGTYSVSLLVTTSVGTDTEIKTAFITVSPPVGPNAEFSGTPRSGEKPLTVQFTDQSTPGTGTITSWSWTFGDGGTSTAQDPSHVYGSDGTYSVSLTIQTSIGSNTETKSGYIVVSTGPTAGFTGTPRSGPKPLTVQFTDQSTPGTSAITGWAWSFGDGGTSTSQNPSHAYAASGNYSVSLTVTTASGTDSDTKLGYILVSDPVFPVAAFSASPRTGIRPLEVHFADQSTPGSFPITSWSWSFGDGGTSTSQNPTHAYAAAGTYDVTLTVTTSAGTDSDTQAGYVVVSNPVQPTAGFTGAPRSGVTPLSVQFTDQSAAGTYPITSWSWSFGDGGTSTSQSPSHTYAAAGTYDVTLTVTTTAGTDSDTKEGYVVASNPVLPTAGFSGTPRSGSVPLSVQFTDQSAAGTYPITSWSWSFGDGGSSTVQNPTHVYNSAGSYVVSLTVTTTAGSDGEVKNDYVVATKPPIAAFEGSPRTGDSPLLVQFTDLSAEGSAPITTWSWSFGDGGTSTSQNPAHTYAAVGTYTVALTVTTTDGSDTETKAGYVTVGEPPAPPAADFSGSPTDGPAPLGVQFTDLSSPGTAPITSWLWSFGDAGTSTEQSPSHTYLLPGTYTVSLAVTTADGSDLATKASYITVCAPPAADFLASATAGVAPLTTQFTDLSVPGEGTIATWSWSFGDGDTSAEQNPAHTYTTPGVYNVSLTVSDGCGTDTETKSGYITVQSPCDAAAYSIADAFVETRADGDHDGCPERTRVHFDADVEAGCSKSVFAKVLLRPEGSTEWAFTVQSACFTITGATTADETWVQVQNLPDNFYEIRIELYECGGTVPVASRDYTEDPDLDNRCYE
jgi:PKD repeat protein